MPFTGVPSPKRQLSVTRCSALDVVIECPHVPSEILIPRNVWSDKAAYEATAKKLAGLFTMNFAAYEEGVSAEVKAAGPVA
jgi:phosphoenolpyruvate carboxykinase (ATP)